MLEYIWNKCIIHVRHAKVPLKRGTKTNANQDLKEIYVPFLQKIAHRWYLYHYMGTNFRLTLHTIMQWYCTHQDIYVCNYRHEYEPKICCMSISMDFFFLLVENAHLVERVQYETNVLCLYCNVKTIAGIN